MSQPSFPHGKLGDPMWAPAPCVCHSDATARPKYSTMTASEYVETPQVLAAKVDLLVQLLSTPGTRTVLYTGAGLSTAAGVPDYASKARGSVVTTSDNMNRLQIPPTYSHRVLASLERSGYIHGWLQQNHDGLAQKAGFPMRKLNEIHGSWFDRNNPVVMMDGTLRKDLMDRMVQWTKEADLCIAMGTSLCGMTADCVAESSAARMGPGLVIINLQETPMDQDAALRIFARCDDVWRMVAKKMKLKIDTQTYSAYATPVRRRASSMAT